MTPPPPPRDPPPLPQDDNRAEVPSPPGTRPLAPREPHIKAAFVPAGQKIVLQSRQDKQPEYSRKGAAFITQEKKGKNPVANEKSTVADQVKKLVEVASSKDSTQPNKQMGSKGPAIEGEKQCSHCAVVCPSTRDLATHNKFWHSNISTKSESVTDSNEKEKAHVVQCQRNFRQQNLSNFRGYKCYRCPHCPAICDSQAQLNGHMGLYHSNTNRPLETPPALTCNQCGFTCDLEAQLMAHMKNHQHSNIPQQFKKQTLSMNQRTHQEMAYQQKVKLDEIKQLKEMQSFLTDIEEFGNGWGSKFADGPKMTQPGGKRSLDESEAELFCRRTEQVYSQGWQPKVVKDYSKEPKIKQADSSQAELSCAMKKPKTEENKFEMKEGELFQPKVFNYSGSRASGRHQQADGMEKAVFGEEVGKGMSGKKECVTNVEKSEEYGGSHWRKRLVGLC